MPNTDMMAVTPATQTRHLIELCELYQYTRLIKEPTRVTSSTKSLIDLFLTNEPVKFATSGVSPIGCRDHSLIYVSRKLSNDPGKVDSNFFCYAATVLSPHRNVLIFTQRLHKPT